MKRLMVPAARALIGLCLAGCSGGPIPAASSPAVSSTAPPTVEPLTTLRSQAIAKRCPTATEGEIDPSEVVLATANIFGAGRDVPPAPGGGDGGTLPAATTLPTGLARVLTFPRVMGCVNPIAMYDEWNGPAGDMIGPTDIASFGGISGIIDANNGMFLVGVFLTDGLRAKPAPERLVFTAAEHFAELAPEIGQTFFVGDGLGRRYLVPADATRLFLGFADAFLAEGDPGWYGNNVGELQVTVEVTEDPG